jgi:hypothetical protein
MGNSCIVNENVDPTKVRLNVRDHAPHLYGDRHIGLNRDCLPPHLADCATDSICSVGSFAVVHGDMGTSPSQRDGNCGSNSATAASHKSNSIVQVFHGVIVCARQELNECR